MPSFVWILSLEVQADFCFDMTATSSLLVLSGSAALCRARGSILAVYLPQSLMKARGASTPWGGPAPFRLWGCRTCSSSSFLKAGTVQWFQACVTEQGPMQGRRGHQHATTMCMHVHARSFVLVRLPFRQLEDA